MTSLVCPSPSERGMTLIEIMVVLAVIGVAAGAVSLGIGAASRSSSVQSEAVRLADMVQLAADQAMVDDRRLTLNWSEEGYSFDRGDGVAGAEALAPHELPAGMRLAIAGRPARLPVIMGHVDSAFTARLSSGDIAWDVHYDGLTAVAQQVGGQ